MLLLVWPIILFFLVVFRFRRRFNAEFDRQHQITWPAVPALFAVDTLELEASEPASEGTPYRSSLANGYEFYTHGKRFTGNQLLPEQLALDESARTTLLQRLNARKDTLQVRYDPNGPVRNFLAVGHGGLSWSKVVVYAFFGVVLPLFLGYAALALLNDPAVWWDAITFGSSENLPTY
jgi:hypothetical protein